MKIHFQHIRTFTGTLLFLLIILLCQSVNAIETIVVGQVINNIDRSPIPEVNIYYKNTKNGVKSNDEGYFMIRTGDVKSTILMFSCIGYRPKEIKIKPGQSVGLEVEMNEQNTILQDVFVIPGANPALEFMKKVRKTKRANDFSKSPQYNIKKVEQGLVLLGKVNQRNVNQRIYNQLTESSLKGKDTSLVLPLYMVENTFEIRGKNKKLIDSNKFSSPEKSEVLLNQLLGEIQTDINFYENSIYVLGKNMISPLSGSGNIYYDFYLTDSTYRETGKLYQINFRTKNPKNLAFNGSMLIDSATYALVSIQAKMSEQVNLNYINNLFISQNFSLNNNSLWTLKDEITAMKLTYEILGDSLHPKPEIFLKNSAVCSTINDTIKSEEKFAGSEYEKLEVEEKLSELNDTRIIRVAKWIADVAITGYVPAGKLEIGKIQQLMRITEIEGLRLTLPLRTNEKLMKNVCIGGYTGYSFKNRNLNYSGYAQFKLSKKLNTILNIGYTNDFRRIDYNYNDFLLYEDPLVTGDVDIVNTVFSLRTGMKMNERKEFTTSVSTDWNKDIESKIIFRSNQILSGPALPMMHNGVDISSISYQSLTATTRFSFDEKIYENHFQRIYIESYRPTIYATVEAGQFLANEEKGKYAILTGTLKQNVKFAIGTWIYLIEGGWLFGNVPYPLLKTPTGGETYSYGYNKFSLIYNMEAAVDKYISMHNELIMNGLVLNQIPLIKLLNLREMFSFKIHYGSLNNSHSSIVDYPNFLQPISKPYMEVGAGVNNIFRLISIQSVWRLGNQNQINASRWGVFACLRIGF